MVSIHREGSTFVIKVLGFHKILAFKSRFAIKASNILNVKIASMEMRPPGIRFPGTSVPGVIVAGTYYGRGKKEFWDRVHRNVAIEVELKNEKYAKVVVDVEDPEATMKLLKIGYQRGA